MNNVGTSYLLWALGFLGFAGIHRLYNRKIFTGLLWLCTFGLLGVGQIIDLFLIPGMVNEHNAWLMFKRSLRAPAASSFEPLTASSASPASFPSTAKAQAVGVDTEQTQGDRKDALMMKLLRAAEARNGRLSVTQGVMDTGHSFSEVEATLREMTKTGYIAAHNDPVSGIVIFDFIELGGKPMPQGDSSKRPDQVFQS